MTKTTTREEPIELTEDRAEMTSIEDAGFADLIKICDEQGFPERILVAADIATGRILVATNGGKQFSTLQIVTALSMLEEATKTLIGRLPPDIQKQLHKRVNRAHQR